MRRQYASRFSQLFKTGTSYEYQPKTSKYRKKIEKDWLTETVLYVGDGSLAMLDYYGKRQVGILLKAVYEKQEYIKQVKKARKANR